MTTRTQVSKYPSSKSGVKQIETNPNHIDFYPRAAADTKSTRAKPPNETNLERTAEKSRTRAAAQAVAKE